MRRHAIFGIFIVLMVIFSGCTMTGISLSNTSSSPTASPSSTFGPEPNWGKPTKTTGCQANGALQDQACTPGDIISDATTQKICTPGYASSVRKVTQSTKDQVFADYGITTHKSGQYEVDHLVSLELGGSNDISNLWPEPATPKPGFHEKDHVENYLHNQVCNGSIPLHQAQIEIATNWLAVYHTMPGSHTNVTNQGSAQP
jgi:hypothetical protein